MKPCTEQISIIRYNLNITRIYITTQCLTELFDKTSINGFIQVGTYCKTNLSHYDHIYS